MNKSCYSKTLGSKRNSVNVNLIKAKEAVLENSDKCLLESIRLCADNIVAFTSRRRQIYWDAPTVIGDCILDVAKCHVNEFPYRVIIKPQNYYFFPRSKTKKRVRFPPLWFESIPIRCPSKVVWRQWQDVRKPTVGFPKQSQSFKKNILLYRQSGKCSTATIGFRHCFVFFCEIRGQQFYEKLANDPIQWNHFDF